MHIHDDYGNGLIFNNVGVNSPMQLVTHKFVNTILHGSYVASYEVTLNYANVLNFNCYF